MGVAARLAALGRQLTSAQPPSPPSTRVRGARLGRLLPRLAVAVGLAVGGLVLAVGLAVVAAQPASWSAHASLLVLPEAPSSEPDVLAGLYDTLSRGQVAATYAELLRTRAVEDDTSASPVDSEADPEIEVVVVPETAVIRVTATAGSRAGAEQAADGVLDRGRRYVASLDTPYDVAEISRADGTAERAGPGLPLLAGVVVVLAVVAAVATHQLLWQLGMLLRRRTDTDADATPPPSSAGPAGEPDADVDPLFEPDQGPPTGNGRWWRRAARREPSR